MFHKSWFNFGWQRRQFVIDNAKHCKRVNNKFKKSYDLPLNLLQYRKVLRYSLFGIAGG